MLEDPNMPKDPFGPDGVPDLTQWAVHCYAMYTSLISSGFREAQALEITTRCMQAMMAKIT